MDITSLLLVITIYSFSFTSNFTVAIKASIK